MDRVRIRIWGYSPISTDVLVAVVMERVFVGAPQVFEPFLKLLLKLLTVGLAGCESIHKRILDSHWPVVSAKNSKNARMETSWLAFKLIHKNTNKQKKN